eukprot:10687681-Alexandrium_andersonii.AAC.1
MSRKSSAVVFAATSSAATALSRHRWAANQQVATLEPAASRHAEKASRVSGMKSPAGQAASPSRSGLLQL